MSSPQATARGVLVVLPTLGDRLDTLAETLESVAGQRRDVPVTLVVVVPPEAGPARRLAESYAARLVDDPRRGISHAINLGVETATDESYYAWIGDDDLFRPGALATLRRLIESTPGAVVAFGGCDYVDGAGRVLASNRAGRWARWLLPWGPDLIPHPGSLIRLDAMRSAGLFDPGLRYAMDLDMFLRLRALGPFASTRTSVSAFRWHADSLTVANRAASGAEADRVKTAHLPRGLRPLSPLWHVPVRWASARAARAMSRRASGLPAGSRRRGLPGRG